MSSIGRLLAGTVCQELTQICCCTVVSYQSANKHSVSQTLAHQLPVTQLFRHNYGSCHSISSLRDSCKSVIIHSDSQLSSWTVETVAVTQPVRQLSTSCWSISYLLMYSQSISCQLDSHLSISEADSFDTRMPVSHFFCLLASQSSQSGWKNKCCRLIKYKTGTNVTLLFLKCSNNNKSLCLWASSMEISLKPAASSLSASLRYASLSAFL